MNLDELERDVDRIRGDATLTGDQRRPALLRLRRSLPPPDASPDSHRQVVDAKLGLAWAEATGQGGLAAAVDLDYAESRRARERGDTSPAETEAAALHKSVADHMAAGSGAR